MADRDPRYLPWRRCEGCDIWTREPVCWVCEEPAPVTASAPHITSQSGYASAMTDKQWREVRRGVLGNSA